MRKDEKNDEKEEAMKLSKIGMTQMRQNLTEEEVEFDNITLKHMVRDLRMGRTGKEHLIEKLKAKKGMQALHREVRLKSSQ